MRLVVESESSRSLPLNGGVSVARAAGGRVVVGESDGAAADPLAAIVPCPGERAREALLILAPGVRATVEGFPCLPAHVLSDREEIVVEGVRLRFGAYEAQTARAYGADEPARRCGRCGLGFEVGQIVVPCPRCDALFHHDPALASGGESQADASSAPKTLDCDRLEDKCPACDGSRSAMLWTPAEGESRDA
jgi:hypothetical protein